jgi:hypothetical protein
MKQNASLDASFWINACEGNLVEFLPDYFFLFASSIVAREIRYPLDVLEIEAKTPLLFNQWCNSGQVDLQDPVSPVDWFQQGENAAIALAIEQGYFLLIDDTNPYHRAKSVGLKVIGTNDFAVFLVDQGRLSPKAATAAIKKMRTGKKQKQNALLAVESLSRRKRLKNV